MNQIDKNANQPTHAVVIGGSIAGLLTARVLADYFTTVTVIERDQLPDSPAFRKGAPQARHAHGLLVRGQQIMEGFFPGLTADLLANGATQANLGSESAFYFGGKWLRPFPSALAVIGCSRALIEHQLYQRLRALPQVHFLQGHTVDGLCTNPEGTHVTGVRLQDRRQPAAVPQTIPATLVVDASGRNSVLPQWLAQLGYRPPTEVTVDAKAGYASRIYRRPATAQAWKVMYYLAEAPTQARGAIIVPIEATAAEGERWLVTLTGLNGDQPPTDDAGFLQFAHSLPSPEFAAALEDAEPLTAPYGYQQAANRLRKYDQLPRYLEGMLALGDAVYALNPVYGQGMTVAALGAQTLQQVLQAQCQRHDPAVMTGLAQTFQRQLAKVIARPWQLATGQDLRWPVAANGHTVDPLTRLLQGYINQVIRTMAADATVAEAFFYVQNMLKSPITLFQPRILWRVWRAGQQVGDARQADREPHGVWSTHVHETG
jgi:2-polyprenyl-6-methoxyphenol hydroxylase-like FAD-dependent oxidoreductase